MSDEKLMKEVKQLKVEVRKIQRQLDNAVGGDQPDREDQITVWENGAPGDVKVAELVKQLRGRPTSKGLETGEAISILDRSRQRTLEIMRELAGHHPKIKFRKGVGNKSSKLHWRDD